MNRYIAYSTGIHFFFIIALFLFINFNSHSKKKVYAINFMGGQSGFGTGRLEPAPAPKTAKKKSAPPATPRKAVNSASSKKSQKKVAVAKKKSPINKKTVSKVSTKKTAPKKKSLEDGRGEATKGRGDTMGSKTAPVGGRGTSLEIGGFGPGSSGISNQNFPYSYYVNFLYQRLWENWDRSKAGTKQCSVSFTIKKDGSLDDVHVTESSGDALFDLMARRAVEVSAPFQNLPEGFEGSNLPVLVRFRLQ